MYGRTISIASVILGVLFILGAALMSRGTLALKGTVAHIALGLDPSSTSPSDRMCVVRQSDDKIYFISCGGIY